MFDIGDRVALSDSKLEKMSKSVPFDKMRGKVCEIRRLDHLTFVCVDWGCGSMSVVLPKDLILETEKDNGH